MAVHKINFACPECGQSRLVEVRKEIVQKQLVDGLSIIESPSPGRKYNVQTGAAPVHSDGKIIGYRCDICGHTLMTKGGKQNPDFWARRSESRPITSQRDLFFWLKREGMLVDDKAKVS